MASSGLLSSFVGILRSNWRPQVEAKRFRYWKDLREKGYQRRFGWEDKLPRGLLPRIEGKKLNSMPIYHAKNGFSEERATKGQNDYIDILGKCLLVSPWICHPFIFLILFILIQVIALYILLELYLVFQLG